MRPHLRGKQPDLQGPAPVSLLCRSWLERGRIGRDPGSGGNETFTGAAVVQHQVGGRHSHVQLHVPGRTVDEMLARLCRAAKPLAGERAGQRARHVRQNRRGGPDDGSVRVGRGGQRRRALRSPAGGSWFSALPSRRDTLEHAMLLHRNHARAVLGVLAVAASTCMVSLWAAKKEEVAAWPEVTEQEKNLKTVTQDPEADAVILRN